MTKEDIVAKTYNDYINIFIILQFVTSYTRSHLIKYYFTYYSFALLLNAWDNYLKGTLINYLSLTTTYINREIIGIGNLFYL